MLALEATLAEAPASMSLATLSQLDETTDITSEIPLWCLVVLAYNVLSILSYLVGCCKSIPRQLAGSVKSLQHSCCPKRRARFQKCSRRYNKRTQAQDKDSDESTAWECPIQRFYKLHLPPPLPFKRHRKKQALVASKTRDSSLSLSSEDTSRTTTANQAAIDQSSATSTKAHYSTLKRVPLPKVVLYKPPRTDLIDLARMQQWDAVCQQVTRRACKIRDTDGLLALHWACSGAPSVTAIQALLDHYPSAARKIDQEGSLPLHFACHYSAGAGVMVALLQVNPAAVTVQDKYGRTPLYHAVDKAAGLEVLELLIKADASTITTPCLRESERDAAELDTRTVTVRTPLFVAWAAVVSDRRVRETRRGKKWDKAVLLLRAAFQLQSCTSTLLHAAITLDIYLPDQVISLILQAHPEQVRHVDPVTGQLPLAVVAEASFYSSSRSDTLIDWMLQAYPQAIKSRDRQGRFPLSLALASGKPWQAGVKRLFDAGPDTLLWRDGETGLVPALVAASAPVQQDREEGSCECVNDPFGLLSAKQRERLLMRQQQPSSDTKRDNDSMVRDVETRRVTTIYELICAHPSAILRAEAA